MRFFYEGERLSQIVTPLGKRIWVTWNEQKIASFRDESGRTVTYQYEGELLTAVTHVNEGVMEYGYDANGYLNQIKREDGREERYGYDGEGKRVAQEGRGRNRRYCYYGNKVLWEEREGGERKRSYVLGYGIEGVEEEGKRYYYQKDERESTTYVSDDEGEIRNRYEYDGYGRVEEKEEELETIFLYTGQEYAKELEGYWLGERIYREEYGRFLKEDAYEGDGLNLYAYCRNNPIVYYDPSGYMGQTNDGKCGTPSEGETKFTAAQFPDGFPKPIIYDLKTYHDFLDETIGIRLDYNDVVLGLDETDYKHFGIRPNNKKNILNDHMKGEDGITYGYWVKDIDILYNKSVGKIHFMVDGMQSREEFNEYLRGNKTTEKGLSITNIELAAVFARSDNLKKTTFYFRGEPIPFSVVKEVLKLPDLPTFH